MVVEGWDCGTVEEWRVGREEVVVVMMGGEGERRGCLALSRLASWQVTLHDHATDICIQD